MNYLYVYRWYQLSLSGKSVRDFGIADEVTGRYRYRIKNKRGDTKFLHTYPCSNYLADLEVKWKWLNFFFFSVLHEKSEGLQTLPYKSLQPCTNYLVVARVFRYMFQPPRGWQVFRYMDQLPLLARVFRYMDQKLLGCPDLQVHGPTTSWLPGSSGTWTNYRMVVSVFRYMVPLPRSWQGLQVYGPTTS